MELFIDQASITAKAGNGGNGCVSYHREKYVPKGGPDGGDGGDGGDVVVISENSTATLLGFRGRTRFFAENGLDGLSNRRTGRRGKDIIIKVPTGTVIRDSISGYILADMVTAGRTKTLLKGGRGGWGNARFATPTRQLPNFAKPGISTNEIRLDLELKVLADVGLVGFPNVGKSTFLSVATSAKPKIGQYHFTTLTPNLGVLRHHGQEIIIADIPGLIEGASNGAGMGFAFLRHLERTRLLLHMIDISGSENRDPVVDYININRELEQYGQLKNKPQILVLNKADLTGASENIIRMQQYLLSAKIPIFALSCVTHTGLKELMDYIAIVYPTLEQPAALNEVELPDSRTNLSEYIISEADGVFTVEGSAIDHLIRSVNFSDPESLSWFHRMLRKTGVIDALRCAGAKQGDTVIMNHVDFDFIE